MSTTRLVCAAALLSASTGCYPDPIQEVSSGSIMVAITTDLVVPTEIDRVHVFAQRETGSAFTHNEPDDFVDAGLLPGTIRFGCPRDECTTEVDIRISGLLGPTQSFVEQRALTTYEPGRVTLLKMPLCRNCLGVVCQNRETCLAGRCVPTIAIAPATLDDYSASKPLEDDRCSIVPSTACEPGVNCSGTPMIAFTGFQIDQREVSRADYRAFLNSNPSISGQPMACEENNRFDPQVDCEDDFCKEGDDCTQQPQTCVDWCDARAYCEWTGKRLCGRIGQTPPDVSDAWNDPAVSEWHHACTANGSRDYPYGDPYQPGLCNGSDADVDRPLDVTDAAGCKDDKEILHQSGNVLEWEDACDTTDCQVRGGSFKEADSGLACSAPKTQRRTQSSNSIGFRCCK